MEPPAPVRVAVALMVLAGCASVPVGEFRGDQYEHRNPAYSFSVPSNWRPATVDDLDAFRYFQLAMKMTYNSTRLREHLRGLWKHIDTALVSPQGAGIFVATTDNSQGLRLPRDVETSRAEREALVDMIMKEFSTTLPEQRSSFRLESAELNQYGPNPALFLNVRSRQDLLGKLFRIRVLILTARRHTQLLTHVGIPDDSDAGLDALEAVARSVRFD